MNKELLEAIDMQNKQAVQMVEQTNSMKAMYQEMSKLKKVVDKTAKKTKHRLEEVEALVNEVNSKVHIDDAEAHEIRSLISKQAHAFATEYFRRAEADPSANLFASKKGQFIRLQHSRLKRHFNVTKYTHIKHLDATNAINFLKVLNFNDFTKFEIRETPKQKEIMALEGAA